MNNTDTLRWLERVANIVHENRNYLTELDSAIGDADHGINMDRGFTAVREKFPAMGEMDIATQFRTVSTTLISKVGGASGPLYGTAFLRASTALANKQELGSAEYVALLAAFVDGVTTRGKAKIGEKTMLDALVPALEAAKSAQERGEDLSRVAQAATDAAEKGMKDTIPMLATKGRASYLEKRSIGHQDPGATSSYLILRSLSEVSEDQKSKG